MNDLRESYRKESDVWMCNKIIHEGIVTQTVRSKKHFSPENLFISNSRTYSRHCGVGTCLQRQGKRSEKN